MNTIIQVVVSTLRNHSIQVVCYPISRFEQVVQNASSADTIVNQMVPLLLVIVTRIIVLCWRSRRRRLQCNDESRPPANGNTRNRHVTVEIRESNCSKQFQQQQHQQQQQQQHRQLVVRLSSNTSGGLTTETNSEFIQIKTESKNYISL